MSLQLELLNRAITTLVCALAYDEAVQSGAAAAVLAELRSQWAPDAESLVDEAEQLGFWNCEFDESDDFTDEEDSDDE